MKKTEKEKIKKIMAVILTAAALGACGGGDETSSSGKATKGIMAVVMGDAALGSKSATKKSKSLTLQAATETLPETNQKVTVPCSTGSAELSQSSSGSVTTDDKTDVVTSMNINLANEIVFNHCVPEDIASTEEVKESDFTLDGNVSEKASLTGSESDLSYEVKQAGDLKISGACDGSLKFNVTVKGSNSSCNGTGTVEGTLCGESVSCTVSGDCNNPSISGTGCEIEDDDKATDDSNKDKKEDEKDKKEDKKDKEKDKNDK